jgi:hypothetical protein
MGAILLFLLAWCIACMIFAELLPFVLELLWYALCYVVECFGIALSYLFKGLFRLIAWLARQGWRGLLFLVMRTRKSMCGTASEDGAADDDDDEAPAHSAGHDPYHAALSLFGLEPGFSRAALSRAYKQAMRQAHPDAGGSTAKAQTVNAARDLLLRSHGWA